MELMSSVRVVLFRPANNQPPHRRGLSRVLSFFHSKQLFGFHSGAPASAPPVWLTLPIPFRGGHHLPGVLSTAGLRSLFSFIKLSGEGGGGKWSEGTRGLCLLLRRPRVLPYGPNDCGEAPRFRRKTAESQTVAKTSEWKMKEKTEKN